MPYARRPLYAYRRPAYQPYRPTYKRRFTGGIRRGGVRPAGGLNHRR